MHEIKFGVNSSVLVDEFQFYLQKKRVNECIKLSRVRGHFAHVGRKGVYFILSWMKTLHQ